MTKAMILAAGRGTRMRHLTEERPKPLIEINGRSLIDRVADKVAAHGITDCVVNVCYCGDQIEAALKKRTDLNFIFSEEQEALETGGGVKKALPLLGNDPFFVLNSDPLWTEPNEPILKKLAAAFAPETTDAVLMFMPIENVFGHDGIGDYFLNADGLPYRKAQKTDSAPYVYGGVQLLSPRLFDDAPDGKFSLNILYDQAERNGRLKAVVHDGNWYHVGTPEAVLLTERALMTA